MLSQPALNRRRLLLGIAAASSAGAAIAVASVSSVSAAENPALLRLADELPHLEAEFLKAVSRRQEAYAKAMAEWPSAPEALRRHGGSGDDLERDVADRAVERDGKCWSLWTLDDVTAAARYAIKREKARCEALLTVAKAYYGRTAELRRQCGYEAAHKAEVAARDALIAHVAAVMTEAPATMAGVVIQAQALAAFGQIEPLYRFAAQASWPWAATFASNVLRIGEEARGKQA